MLTPWGEKLNRDHPLSEYPRPQMRREQWANLNGQWDYAITATPTLPKQWAGQITVPFSPESELGGGLPPLQPAQTLWYRRQLTVSAGAEGHCLLHFGGVDQYCQVFVDRQKLVTHRGGYWPFSCELPASTWGKTVELIVAVQDHSDQSDEATGKQRLQAGGIWYPPQSGIWQTVWLEQVPATYISDLTLTPDLSNGQVTVKATLNQATTATLAVAVTAHQQTVAVAETADMAVTLTLPDKHPWTPEDPFLYEVTVQVGEDTVTSYFGLRSFGRGVDANGQAVFLLNGEPYYQSGLLDQGYWSDGLYTAPSDAAIVAELRQIKALGFNMIRKHIKIEPLRWYYHCDQLGLLVWQDFVSGGDQYSPWVIQILPFIGITLKDTRAGFGRQSSAGRAVYHRDLQRTVALLKNVVSLCTWVPFNEGWGQFATQAITQEVATLDPTRLIDQASGWHDQHGGDFRSWHIYYKPFHLHRDRFGRIQALTEFGGYSLPWPGHAPEEAFGYRYYHSRQKLSTALVKLYRKQVLPAVKQGLAASIYTQVSDVHGEVNGLWTFDRRVMKVEAEAVRQLNLELQQRFAEVHLRLRPGRKQKSI